MFTDPEFARVGLSETEAKERGIAYRLARFPEVLQLCSLSQRSEEPPAAAATTNLNSAKAEAKLVKALDYLVAINDNSDNPAQKMGH
jgi:hypothetical protein